MEMVQFEPFRNLVSLQERMNRLLNDSHRAHVREHEDCAPGASWAPPVDIFEKDGNIVVKAELPGIDPKDVQVHVENNVLTIKGERKLEQEVKEDKYHRVERAYGAFVRSFTLPNNVDTSKIQADYKDGILQLSLPQREEAKPKQISINVAK